MADVDGSLSAVEPVSAPPKRKLENRHQRPEPETRPARAEMPEIADQRLGHPSLTCGNVGDSPPPGNNTPETGLHSPTRASTRGGQQAHGARSRCSAVDRDAVVKALESGQLAGYAGDVWYPQPAPASHPWRTMPHEGMTPHTSGSTLSAQARYSAGTREILECFYSGRPIREEYLIAQGGHLAGAGAHSYSVR